MIYVKVGQDEAPKKKAPKKRPPRNDADGINPDSHTNPAPKGRMVKKAAGHFEYEETPEERTHFLNAAKKNRFKNGMVKEAADATRVAPRKLKIERKK